MKKNQLSSLFLLMATLLPVNIFAQQSSNLLEKNLPDNSVKKAPLPATEAQKNNEAAKAEITNSVLVKDQSKDSLFNILIGNKITSLMFDDEENSNIDRAIESLKNNQLYSPEVKESQPEIVKSDKQPNQESEKSYIYLASLMYFTPKSWVVWVNDQKITSETNDKNKELFIKSVKKDQVSLVWKLSLSKWKVISGKDSENSAPKVNSENQVEISFELKPNQTFSLSNKGVSEGKVAINILKKEEDKKLDDTSKTKQVGIFK